MAEFCVGWLKGKFGQVEPLGVHAGCRNLGLGRCILVECLRRLYAYGAEEIHVELDKYWILSLIQSFLGASRTI